MYALHADLERLMGKKHKSSKQQQEIKVSAAAAAAGDQAEGADNSSKKKKKKRKQTAEQPEGEEKGAEQLEHPAAVTIKKQKKKKKEQQQGEVAAVSAVAAGPANADQQQTGKAATLITTAAGDDVKGTAAVLVPSAKKQRKSKHAAVEVEAVAGDGTPAAKKGVATAAVAAGTAAAALPGQVVAVSPEGSLSGKKRKKHAQGAAEVSPSVTTAAAGKGSTAGAGPRQGKELIHASKPGSSSVLGVMSGRKPAAGAAADTNGLSIGPVPQSAPPKLRTTRLQQLGTPGFVGGLKTKSAAAGGVGGMTLANGVTSPKAASTGKKRGVVINERKNLYFAYGAPPPEADVRTPPRAQPKGSALKKGNELGPNAGSSSVPVKGARSRLGTGGLAAAAVGGQRQHGGFGGQQKAVTPNTIPRAKAANFF
jgi:ribosomal RNA-processing protein 1